MSATVSSSPLSLMSCVRESSPVQDLQSDLEVEKTTVGTKRKFWNPRKWFRRKNKSGEDGDSQVLQPTKDALRSRSTSELSVAEENIKRRSVSLHPGLSVSHDSVFHSPHSTSDLELDTAHSTSSLTVIHPVPDIQLQTELSERLRLRRGRGDTSEDDEGLPRSPCNSPTTTDGLLEKSNKSIPVKSHSTCSDGSLLSMGSTDMEEDSTSHHSSKMSLYEKKSTETDSDFELGQNHTPLNHSAAHHKNAIKPKRTHGAPRRKKPQQLPTTTLPSTPEVNEDSSIRSLTPDIISKETTVEIRSTRTTISAETQFKCSSLPPGLTPPGTEEKLSRSISNVESKEEDEDKTDKSFFDRLFPRRSAKKKKSKEEQRMAISSYSLYSRESTTSSNTKATEKLTGAAARQRILPLDIPVAPDNFEDVKHSPEKPLSSSPLQTELEQRFKHRMAPSFLPPSPKETRLEELRNKVKIAGLSSLQQRVLSLSEDVDDGAFKSLTDIPTDNVVKPVTKSHSFKSAKPDREPKRFTYTTKNEEKDMSFERKMEIIKASSLDSIKNLEDKGSVSEKVIKTSEIVEKTSDVSVTSVIVPEELVSIKEQKVTTSKENNITVQGKTIVTSITSNKEDSSITAKENCSSTRNFVSITDEMNNSMKEKIPSSKEFTTTGFVKKQTTEQELFNKHLNKIETTQSNVVFKTSLSSPRIVDEHTKTKNTVVEEMVPLVDRKFSKENVEIIDKEVNEEVVQVPKTSLVTITSMTPQSSRMYKKNNECNLVNSQQRKSSLSEKPPLKTKDYLSDRSSQDSLDKLEDDGVVLRRKSLGKRSSSEEETPELMKVFARRSLKLKDSESEQISENVQKELQNEPSDKENSPQEETQTETNDSKFIESVQVTLRKPLGNNKLSYQRTASLQQSKVTNSEVSNVKKQPSLTERPKTENWFINTKKQEVEKEEHKSEIIKVKSDFINEDFIAIPKNFNQRKAEWEKRAQEAQKKSA